MASVSQSLNTGRRIGASFLGGLVGDTSETPAAKRAADMDIWTMKEKIKGGLGVDLDVRTGTWSVTDPYYTPDQAAVAKKNHMDRIQTAYDNQFNKKIKLIELGNKIEKNIESIVDADGATPETNKTELQLYDKHLKEFLGPELYEAAGISDSIKRQGRMVDSADRKKESAIRYRNMISAGLNKYITSRDPSDLLKYDLLWNKDPEAAKNSGYPDPTEARKEWTSNVMQEEKLKRQKDSAQVQTAANLASQKDKAHWEVKRAGPDDELYREGTTYATSPGEKPVVLQQPLTPDKLTQSEKDLKDRIEAVPRIKELVEKEGPNAAYKSGIQMNDDGTPYIDPVNGAVVVLPEFEKVAGKRSATTNLMRVGEAMDDAQEIIELLNDPVVAKELNKMDSGVLNEVIGKTENEIRTYLQKKGFTGGSKKTREAIARIGAYSSVERKNISGAAITDTESAFFESWMPSSGDTFDVTMSKIQLAAAEGEQEFTRFLDIYKNRAKMHDFYAAFGIDRFDDKSGGEDYDIEITADGTVNMREDQ